MVLQAVGKIPIDVNELKIDLMSISGHKMYGPKGIGALYVRRRPRVRLEAQMNGGGQERGMRSGTLPAFLAVGLGESARVCAAEMEADTEHITRLSKMMHQQINDKVTTPTAACSPTLNCLVEPAYAPHTRATSSPWRVTSPSQSDGGWRGTP